MKRVIIKIFLTLLVTMGIVWPLVDGSSGSGILREVEQLGWAGASIVAVCFLAMVALYCRDLQRTLEYISPVHRVSSPRSVWYMFLIPYNFVEDFFIVSNIAVSLQRQASSKEHLNNYSPYGKYSGLGWCSAQIVSIAPGYIGQTASLVAILLWVVHWRFIRKVNIALKADAHE